MAKAQPKLVLSPSRDIPFDKLILSQSNVRTIKAGVSIEDLADDIDRRGLLHGLNVRPHRDAAGAETDLFEVPAGGRRYRALEILVKRKRFAKDGPVPCVVKATDDPVSAEEDSLAENTFREPLHPLDEFRAMKRLADKGQGEEEIAAHFRVTPAVVRQRLKLASVSPKLHEVYAEGAMTLDQLMAFSVNDDHTRQEQVWELLTHAHSKSPGFIRQRMTENTVRAYDRRALFVGLDAYIAAGGSVMRDLFEADDGGWLQDAALLDRLVADKFEAEAQVLRERGWKWVAVAVEFPYGHNFEMSEIEALDGAPTEEQTTRVAALRAEVEAVEAEYGSLNELPDEVVTRVEAIEEELEALLHPEPAYDPAEMARAGVFLSLDDEGTLEIEAGFIRPDDELAQTPDTEEEDDDGDGEGDDDTAATGPAGAPGARSEPAIQRTVITLGGRGAGAEPEEDEGEILKPLPDRLVQELTAHRTLALQDAFAQSPSVAFAAVLHVMVLSTFYGARWDSCLGLSMHKAEFPFQASGLKDSASAKAIEARRKRWDDRLPKDEHDLWDALQQLDATDQAALFAFCASNVVNAVREFAPRYDTGRITSGTVARRIAHSDVLARAVGLDMVGAGWIPTVDNYLGRVTKAYVLKAVTEGKGAQAASLIDHLKKDHMAREAERLLADAAWLPEPLRTPVLEAVDPTAETPVDAVEPTDGEGEALPEFLAEDEARAGDPDPAHAMAAE